MQVMPISKHCSGVAPVKTVLFGSTVEFLTVTFSSGSLLSRLPFRH